jgi:hypothetical protein
LTVAYQNQAMTPINRIVVENRCSGRPPFDVSFALPYVDCAMAPSAHTRALGAS